MNDFDNAPWTGRIKPTGFLLYQYAVYINHGVMRYGPDGGPFLCVTYKGAKRLMEREIRRGRIRTAREIGFREMQEGPLESFQRQIEEAS